MGTIGIKNPPKEEGFYWVKTTWADDFSAIVKVYGVYPFYRVRGYNWSVSRHITDISEIIEFGSKIEEI